MNLFWSRNTAVPNWGDDINPFIFSKLLGIDVNYVESNYQAKHYIGIGSILNNTGKHSIILGAGFINQEDGVIAPPNGNNSGKRKRNQR